MRKLTIIALFLALLVGCASLETPTSPQSVPVYHPPFPAPYKVCTANLEILEDNERAMVAVTYDDNITLAICQTDTDRYIRELIDLACSYRSELSERMCNKELNE